MKKWGPITIGGEAIAWYRVRDNGKMQLPPGREEEYGIALAQIQPRFAAWGLVPTLCESDARWGILLDMVEAAGIRQPPMAQIKRIIIWIQRAIALHLVVSSQPKN